MALLVADTRREEFSKPPPKKKWLQEYIEQDSQHTSITSNLSTEAREFVRLFDKQTDENFNSNIKQLAESTGTKGNITLSQDVIGGVVQGVLNQFQSFFEEECSQAGSAKFESQNLLQATSELKVKKLSKLLDPVKNGAKFNESLKRLSWPGSEEEKQVTSETAEVKEDLKMSQNDIAPVVQSVISQFLNGSLADSDFRRSRKRSHKHANCHHRDKSSSSGPSHRARRSSSVIKFKSKSPEVESQSQSIKLEAPPSENSVTALTSKVDSMEDTDENEALNLSLPKQNQRVTFAAHDRCYSSESVKSFQPSKSEELSNLDILARASDDRTKLSISEDKTSSISTHTVSTTESMMLAAKNLTSINATSQDNEHRYYQMSKSYIELSPVIRCAQKAESPMNMTLATRKDDPSFRPIVRKEMYGSHSPPPLEVARPSHFSSLPSSRQTSPVCLKKTPNNFSVAASASPTYFPLEAESAPSSMPYCPNVSTTSSPSHVACNRYYNSTSPILTSSSNLASQHVHHPGSPPPLTMLKTSDPINYNTSMYSFPVIKPKPMKSFLESTEMQSKPIMTSNYHSKPLTLGSYPQTALTEMPLNAKAAQSSSGTRMIKDKAESNSKEEIKRTSTSTREVHNRLEKNRRAHLKMCFDELAVECDLDPKKASNLTVIRSAYKCIMSLRRKERENERNLAALVQEKIRRQNLLEELKREFPGYKSESDCE